MTQPKSLVVQALEESKMRCVAPHLRDRIDKAIRIAEIEGRAMMILDQWRLGQLTQRALSEGIAAILVEHDDATQNTPRP